MGIVFGLLYASIVSLGKVVLKHSLKELNPSVSFFYETIFGLLIWLPFGFLAGVEINQVVEIFPYVLLGAILSEAYIFYIYTKGDVSIIGTVFPTYPIYTIFFSYLFLGERLELNEFIFVAVVILGVLLISIPKRGGELFKSISPVLWATSGAIAVGFADSVGKGAINDTSAATFLFCLGLMQIPVSIAFLKLEKESIWEVISVIGSFHKYKYSLLSAFLIALAQLFFWLSFDNTLASIASPISSASVIFTVIFAIVLLKEKVPFKNIIGTGIVLVGIVGLGVV